MTDLSLLKNGSGLELSDIDFDNEVEVSIDYDYSTKARTYIKREDAIRIVEFLREKFKL